jgi:hypothetical protein
LEEVILISPEQSEALMRRENISASSACFTSSRTQLPNEIFQHGGY